MARLIGSPVTTTVQLGREIYEISIAVSMNGGSPFYILRGQSNYITRDVATGEAVGDSRPAPQITIPHGSLPGSLITGISNLIARLDTISLPEDTQP